MGKLWRLAMILALVAVACRAEANVVLDIAEDGSGTYTVELGLDDELQELLAGFTGGEGGLIPGFDFGALGLDDNPLDSIPSRTDGDMTYYGNSATFATLDELKALIANAAGEGNNFDAFDVTLEDEKVRVSATAGAPGDLAGDVDLPISLDFFESAFTASVIIDMPGTVTEHNADEVLPDGSLKWDISLTDGVDIQALSDLSESSFPWVFVIVILVLLAALGLVLVVMRRNSATAASAVAATPPPPEPMGFTPDTDDDLFGSR